MNVVIRKAELEDAACIVKAEQEIAQEPGLFCKQGDGKKLLAAAEREAIENGCRFSLVDTWDFQIESDMTEDFYLIAKTIDGLNSKEKEKLANGSYHFMELKEILNENGYSSAEAISQKLLDIYVKQDQRL
jgi:hypothetical protein